MAGVKAWISILTCCIVTLIVIKGLPCHAAPSSPGPSWRTARSLTSSLLHRIADHRLAKGDAEGVERINHIITILDRGLSFWANIGLLSWDYIIHYSWRSWNPSQVFDVLRLIGDIQTALAEFSQLSTDMDRLQWMYTNYNRVLKLATAAIKKLLTLFDQPGALRNLMLAIQTEILRGAILQDAMQLGTDDLQGLFQVTKEMLRKYYGQTFTSVSSEL